MATQTSFPATYGMDASIPTFTVDQYQQMIETGILKPEDKVELLENYLVRKMTRNPPHDGTIDLVYAALGSLPSGWLLRNQQTIVLSDSQSEPDFSVVRGTPRSFVQQHPDAGLVGLVIEIANTSLLRDQQDKTRIYARANIPCYWIVNLVDECVEVHTQPTGPTATSTYQAVRSFRCGEQVALVLDGTTVATVDVADLLP